MTKAYEINTVLWLRELSDKYSKPVTLANVPGREWDRLKRLGCDYVWLMGVWQRSRIGKRVATELAELHPCYAAALPDWTPEDIAGSPYSIEAYRPDDAIGDWTALDGAREQLGRRGIGLVLDLVANHTGIDFPWIKRNPERYLQATDRSDRDPSHFVEVTSQGRSVRLAKGRDPYFPPWHDTAQLNIFSASTRKALMRLVKDIGKHCDGLRCDMAMLLLTDIFYNTWEDLQVGAAPATEFWADVIGANRRLLWIGEAYWDTEWKLQQLGFDFVYDKRMYERLRYGGPEDVKAHLQADLSFQEKLVRFLENHDEERSVAVFESTRLRAASVIAATIPGMTMYHQGQLEGRRTRIPLQLRRSAAEPADEELQAFYQELLRITRDSAFKSGEWELLYPTSAGDETYRNVVAYAWRASGRLKVVTVNFSGDWGQARIPLKLRASSGNYRLKDELTGEVYDRDSGELANPGLHVLLNGYQSHIFDIRL